MRRAHNKKRGPAARSGVPLVYDKGNAETEPLLIKEANIDVGYMDTATSWGASLGLKIDSQASVIQQLRAGLKMASVDHLSRKLEVPVLDLAKMTLIAQRTLARRRQEGRLHLDESERVFRLASLFDRACEVLGSAGAARKWCKSSKKALGGKTPFAMSDTELGAREVEDLLGRLEQGVFS